MSDDPGLTANAAANAVYLAGEERKVEELFAALLGAFADRPKAMHDAMCRAVSSLAGQVEVGLRIDPPQGAILHVVQFVGLTALEGRIVEWINEGRLPKPAGWDDPPPPPG